MRRNLREKLKNKGMPPDHSGRLLGSVQVVLLLCLSILLVLGTFFYPTPSVPSRPKPAVSHPEPNFVLSPSETLLQLANPSGTELPKLETSIFVEVSGFGDELGDCMVAVYDSSASFNKIEQSIVRESKKIQGNSMQFRFADVDSKSFAIAAFHDQNRNGQLDKNAFGIPTERYGFSNNPTSTFGPPSFRAAEVHDLEQANGPIKIFLNSLKLSGSK